jgi:hypothetical protein
MKIVLKILKNVNALNVQLLELFLLNRLLLMDQELLIRVVLVPRKIKP